MKTIFVWCLDLKVTHLFMPGYTLSENGLKHLPIQVFLILFLSVVQKQLFLLLYTWTDPAIELMGNLCIIKPTKTKLFYFFLF